MAKRAKRWPILRIATLTAACVVAAVVLFWLSVRAEDVAAQQGGPVQANPRLTLSGFLVLLAGAATVLGVLGLVWLGLRIRELRLPAWERQRRRKRR